MRVGFVGAGNMAQAIIKGMLDTGFVTPDAVSAFDTEHDKLHSFCRDKGIQARSSNEELVAGADVIVLAVKPGSFAGVLAPLRTAVREKRPLIVSIAAGTSLATIGALLEDATLPIVRVMPNVNAQIGASMSALCGSTAVSGAQMDWAEALFATLGRTLRLDEELFSVFSATACASPAFAFMFIEALARGGVRGGLTKQQAVLAAAQAVMGSARLVLESAQHPCALVDAVCSPGGTSIAGVAALEEGAFTATIMRAVAATTQRDKELLAAQPKSPK